MKTSLDTLVKTAGNQEAIERVTNVTGDFDAPQRLFIVGPVGSGKTSLLRARAGERDLLSSKKVVVHSAGEMMSVLRMNAPDKFFEEIGSVPVLLVDDFQGFLSEGKVGTMFCKLMMRERDRLGLDTVFASTIPLAECASDELEGALDGFEEITIEPLDEEGRRSFVRLAADVCAPEEGAPVLSDEAIEYLANEFSSELKDIRNAVTYLVSAAGLPANEEVSLDTVKKALSR